MRKEASQVSQLALLKPMHAFILRGEKLTELLLVHLEQMAEPLANVPVVRQVGTVLHATLDHHGAEFDLLPGADLQLEQFVTALLELYGRHYDQVDCLTQLG